MKVNGLKCDGCGVERQQSNHWFLVHTCDGAITFTQWDNDSAFEGSVKHICGHVCAQKLLNEFLSK
jgi:hypothetical protein